MKRQDIDKKYKWDLSDLYKSFNEVEEDIKKIPKMIEKVASYKGKLLESSETLWQFIKSTRETEEIIEKLDVFCFLLVDVEMDNKDAKKYGDKVDNIITEYQTATAYVIPELLAADYEVIEKLISEKEELKVLEKWFKELYRAKEHTLSEREESILSTNQMISSNFGKSSTFITDKEIDYGEIEVNGENVKLMASNLNLYAVHEDRNVRKQVYNNERSAIGSHIDSLATNYISFIKSCEAEAKFRGFNSYLEQVFYSKNLDIKVYDTLKSSVLKYKSNYIKFVQLLKKALGYDEIKPYDLNAPIVKESSKKYTVEEAKEIILDTYSFLGEKYIDTLTYAFTHGSIDYFPCENKSTGWSSIYSPYTKPRVFANYEGKILDISSLCHELGHFCNQFMIIENQLPEYVYQATFCAEVSSLTNEILFANIFKDKEEDKSTKAAILYNFIKIFISNFFGASKQALFEERTHTLANKGEALSSDVLCDIWLDIHNEVCGDEVNDVSPYVWAEIPHFFLGGGYYCYNYSTAIIAACNVAHKLLTNEDGFKEKYMKYLTIGSSETPLDSLMLLGIDMTDSKVYDVAMEMFDKALSELYELLETNEVK
ncbi:MAG: hypothetical protein J1F35_07445 [Erysipelotrichales bacterium]|nr:hypothetical protein [Erysipelotrichales bacterium]